MKNFETSNMIKRIDRLIRSHATGTPDELCHKLNTSRSTWYNILKILIEEEHFPIAYSKELQSYYYTEEGYYEPGRFVRREGDIL